MRRPDCGKKRERGNEAMFDVNIYLRQNHHGVRPKDAKICGVVEYQTRKGPATYTFIREVENVTAHRLSLFGITEAIKILGKPCELDISTDDEYTADMWGRGLPEKWEKNGWKKADGTEVKNADLWKELKNAPHIVKMRFSVKNEYAGWQERELEKEKRLPIP